MDKITLKAARVNKGLTQKDVAEIGKIGLSTIGAWERGTADPDYLQLLGLASLYGVDVDSILMPKDNT
jgi:transcriptional regulator with XRE-family HTH domain